MYHWIDWIHCFFYNNRAGKDEPGYTNIPGLPGEHKHEAYFFLLQLLLLHKQQEVEDDVQGFYVNKQGFSQEASLVPWEVAQNCVAAEECQLVLGDLEI
jgi:hypothetical protein